MLGPLEGPVALPGGKPRALLARLLLTPGRVVAADALVADLWERPTPSAPKVLQAHVSALRKALGADAIETRAPGYRLRDATTDLARFEELADRARDAGDPARRSALLREALGLWRGEPLAEFRREPFATAAGVRIAELRLAALERRIDAELELGEHERLVPELRALVAEEPLREPFRRQLMLALYRSGRQADALAVYRDTRRTLVDELGIEPSHELQALEAAILRQDAQLARPEREHERRGPVVCFGCAPLELVAALDREVLLVDVAADAASLPEVAARLRAHGPSVRTACFVSADPAADVARLARDQDAELLVVQDATPELLAAAPCDVAMLLGAFAATGPVLVPFGGGGDEWPALELAAWVARAHGLPLRLVGVAPEATRMLAAASLAVQRFAGVTPEPAVAAAADLAAQPGALLVASLARRALAERANMPALLVQGGLRPGGLAPDRTLTRFTWSAEPAAA